MLFDGIGKLGFGFMRLPRNGEDFDLEQTCRMVDAFLEAGFTYFDTAWSYHGSEEALGKTLVQRHPRESFRIATKMAPWRAKSREEALAQFETSLERTGAGYFDFYLLHNMGEHRTRTSDEYGAWDFVLEKKREGLVRNVGFSFHSTPEELDALLTAHPEMDFVQLQLNYGDWEAPTVLSRRCYEVARRHGKPIVVMEPVKGGLLASPPAQVADILKAADPGRSPAVWALRFTASLEGVAVVLSGMSAMPQMEDNLAAMKGFTPMSEDELATIERARKVLASIPVIPCTACDYCAEVCPNDIGVSLSFAALNTLTLYGDMKEALRGANWLVEMHGRRRADLCVRCGACEEVCPQHIAIRDELARVCETLGLGKES